MARNRPRLRESVVRGLIPNSKILFAVSGGADSMSLLHAAIRLKRLLKIEIGVAHINHKLRENSKQDENLVSDFSKENQLSFYCETLCPPTDSRNIEAWAREERYKFLENTRSKFGYDWIATAHNANDVAETLLMRLIANKEPNSIEQVDSARHLVRPLLYTKRTEIENYCQRHRIPFIVDETNLDTTYLRNRVRHTLLPLLEEQFASSIVDSLAERAGIFAEDESCLSSIAKSEIGGLKQYEWGSESWTDHLQARLASLPMSLAWRVIEEVLREKLGYSIGALKAKAVLKMLTSNGKRLDLAAGAVLEHKDGRIEFKSS